MTLQALLFSRDCAKGRSLSAVVNQSALNVKTTIETIVNEFYSLAACLEIAADPGTNAMIPQTLPGYIAPIGRIPSRDGGEHIYHFTHYLELIRSDPGLIDGFKRHWVTGAFLSVGDELSAHDYFDHAPELELVYHLRNAIAHGNRFSFTKPGLKRLAEYPAHNEFAWGRGESTVLRISPTLQDQEVVPKFLVPGDAIDILNSVGIYLFRFGTGESLGPKDSIH
jgi:hypothetical protein